MENEKPSQDKSWEQEPLRGTPGLRQHLETFLPSNLEEGQKDRLLEFLSEPEFKALQSFEAFRMLTQEEFDKLKAQMKEKARNQGNINFFPVEDNIQRTWERMHGKGS